MAPFLGKSQLFIYHFMFGPDWEAGCSGCSFLADHIDSANQHLPHADLAVAVVARAPYEKLAAYRARMDWKFNFVSSYGSDFNYDYGVSFTPEQLANNAKVTYNYELTEIGDCEDLPGSSVFFRNAEGEIFHTYSSFSRGGEQLINTFNFLDLAPKGRNEEAGTMSWMRRHDEYGIAAKGALPEFRFERGSAMNFMGLAATYIPGEMGGIPAQWQRFLPRLSEIPGMIGGELYGIKGAWTGEAIPYTAAAQVEHLEKVPAGLTASSIPARDYAVFTHDGPLDELNAFIGNILETWPKEQSRPLTSSCEFIEVYPTDFDPVTKPKLEIWLQLDG